MTTFVLVPGMWLGAWAWRDVVTGLRQRGHEAYPLSLSGLAERAHLGGPGTDLDLHTTDIVALIEAEELEDVVLVAHSYAGLPVTGAAYRRPERLRQVVYVDSGPFPDGARYLDFHPQAEQDRIRDQVGDGWRIPLPPFEPEQDPVNLAGLSPAHLDAIRRRGTPHPFGTATQPLRLTRDGNHPEPPVPVALVACTMTNEQVQAMIDAGNPFFAGAAGAPVVPLPTGHWPMFSAPDELAEVLVKVSEA